MRSFNIQQECRLQKVLESHTAWHEEGEVNRVEMRDKRPMQSGGGALGQKTLGNVLILFHWNIHGDIRWAQVSQGCNLVWAFLNDFDAP
jgi:flavin reductase (DIM6/NTAB) family NADH-FMN oxidoreductase RutF